jgi:hypothetical protein
VETPGDPLFLEKFKQHTSREGEKATACPTTKEYARRRERERS